MTDLAKKTRVRNDLAETLPKYDFSKIELDIFFFLLSKISKDHTDETTYILDSKKLIELTGTQYNLYEYVEAAKALRNKTLVIEDEESILVDGLLSNVRFLKGKGVIVVKVSSDMKPFILNLTANYTALQLFSLLKLKSKYAKRFYIFFSRHKPMKGIVRAHLEYTIEEFKSELGLHDEEGKALFKQIYDLKKYVLDVAKEQINDFSDIKIQYKLRKLGREYFYIDWDIENKDNLNLIPSYEEGLRAVETEKTFSERIDDTKNLVILVDYFKLSKTQAEKTLRIIKHEALNEVLTEVDEYIKKGTVKNRGAYTVKAIKDKFGIKL
jgi:plasmid replication initiation protein